MFIFVLFSRQNGKRQEDKEAENLKDRTVCEKVTLEQRPAESGGVSCTPVRERYSRRWEQQMQRL